MGSKVPNFAQQLEDKWLNTLFFWKEKAFVIYLILLILWLAFSWVANNLLWGAFSVSSFVPPPFMSILSFLNEYVVFHLSKKKNYF